jgi:hypothetical protein
VFGKGKRLPVFATITFSIKEGQKKQKSKKNKSKKAAASRFNKQNSEILNNPLNLDSLLSPSTHIVSSKKLTKKKIVFAE